MVFRVTRESEDTSETVMVRVIAGGVTVIVTEVVLVDQTVSRTVDSEFGHGGIVIPLAVPPQVGPAETVVVGMVIVAVRVMKPEPMKLLKTSVDVTMLADAVVIVVLSTATRYQQTDQYGQNQSF